MRFWYGWRKQIPVLAQAGCRVIVPDQRGYNLSEKPRGIKAYSVNTLVDHILGLINALDYEKVNLIGHDWGAVIAWMLVVKYPEKLHRLGILNGPHPAVMRRFLTRDFEQMRRSLYAYFFQIPWLPEAILKMDDWSVPTKGICNHARSNAFT